jgi:MATE family multidrug resistance protein
MIFGRAGFPELGIQGAGIATAASAYFTFFAYLVLISRSAHNREFCTLSGWRFDWQLFKRLLRFGLPGGMQFFLDVAGFSAFIFLIGRLGPESLAATNIAFNINTLAFMPMIGCGISVSVLVGQYLGRDRPDLAERVTWSGLHVTLVYMSTWAALYVLFPGVFLLPYEAGVEDMAKFEAIRNITVVLLRFVALYSVFDTMNIIFASALKGAGDTRFIMLMLAGLSTCVLVAPAYIVLVVFKRGINAGWTVITVYIIVLAFSFLARFLQGKWKSMRVIEEHPPSIPPALPETPGEA